MKNIPLLFKIRGLYLPVITRGQGNLMHYPKTKLPNVGTTIFSEMSKLATQHSAINLSQGFPDFDGPEELLTAVSHFIAKGNNQYAPSNGIVELRKLISSKTNKLYDTDVCADTEITITSGATEAIFAAISATVSVGDEVILFDPCYDSYQPAIELNGGRVIRLPLKEPDFSIDWQQLADNINNRTRMVVINNPHNPTGAVLSEGDLNRLAELLHGTNILLLSDEVYEHIVYDGQLHQSVHRHPELAKRSFIISSFGKTFHITGWKLGYCIAPAPLTSELRKVHQYLTFSTATPFQYALADYLKNNPDSALQLPTFYQQKRDFFASLLNQSRLKLLPCLGTYFQLVDYSNISDEADTDFCARLITDAGVAAIPLSPFSETPTNTRIIRLCFAKGEETLKSGAERLCKI